MLTRIVLIATLLAFGGITLDGAPATDGIDMPTLVQHAAADTCDGWPYPVDKILDECPHGPTP